MAKRPPTRAPKREAFLFAGYDVQDIRSMQALALYAKGAERPWPPGEEPDVPTPYDVKRVLDWIVYKAAMTYENPTLVALMAGQTQGDMAPFIDGKRSVGQEIVKLQTLKASAFDQGGPRNEEGIGPERESIASREI